MNTFLLDAAAAVIAFFLSLIPILIWLSFWLFEDGKHPEPKKYLLLAFVAGMASVFLVLPLEAAAASYVPMSFFLLLTWAFIEETAKFGFAWFTVLRLPTCDEPIDIPIYLITTALGFSAVENAFFLFKPVMNGIISQTLQTGDLRFIGATLIHVLSSALIGGALALVFYQERARKIVYGTLGVILAVFLHAFFNFLIILKGAGSVLTVFMLVWVGIVFLLLALERVKEVERPQWWEKTFMKRNV
ncbi:MAG: PrsW family intramembrane metalloprotease [Patescibacteria group bacterium]|nr:PrsW family intramembrane metalloprotease [Patescibacteria group bacterium]